MSDSNHSTWTEVMERVMCPELLSTAVQHAATGLSEMVGHPINIEVPRVETMPIRHVARAIGDPETPIVGVYLEFDGDLDGQAILLCPLATARRLVDLLMNFTPGTTILLDDIERSALAEAGNLTVSFFLNEMSALTGLSLRPSPPAVMIDMMGAILDVVVTPIASRDDNVLFVETVLNVETVFRDQHQKVHTHFWVLPGSPRARRGNGKQRTAA